MIGLLFFTLILSFLIQLLVKVMDTRGFSKGFPGPSLWLKLPLVAHGYLIGDQAWDTLWAMRQKYGPVFRLDVGRYRTVFLCDWESICEAVKSNAISDRPLGKSDAAKYSWGTDSKGEVLGVTHSNGTVWQEQHTFMQRAFYKLGMGKYDVTEAVIIEEANIILERFKLWANDKTIIAKISSCFMSVFSNIAWRLATGYKMNAEDINAVSGLVLTIRDLEYQGSIFGVLQNQFLWFAKIMEATGSDLSVIRMKKKLRSVIEKAIVYQKPDPDGYYIEQYLHKISKATNKPKSSFHGKDGHLHLRGNLLNIFTAGTDTSASAMEWIILYACAFPEAQDKIHKEINCTFGLTGSISLKDSNRLPYLEAFILEVIRHSPGSSLMVPRLTQKDILIKGLRIPKETQVIFFPKGVFHDPKRYRNPMKFQPGRFLDQDGLFHRDERIFGFGLGNRKCPGEKLGQSELFLMSALLFQQFKFNFGTLKPQDISRVIPGGGAHPKPFDVRIELRAENYY